MSISTWVCYLYLTVDGLAQVEGAWQAAKSPGKAQAFFDPGILLIPGELKHLSSRRKKKQ